jgi:hypothetical protein
MVNQHGRGAVAKRPRTRHTWRGMSAVSSSTTSARRAAAVIVFLVLAAMANCEKRDRASAVQPKAPLEEVGVRLSNVNEVYTP